MALLTENAASRPSVGFIFLPSGFLIQPVSAEFLQEVNLRGTKNMFCFANSSPANRTDSVDSQGTSGFCHSHAAADDTNDNNDYNDDDDYDDASVEYSSDEDEDFAK